MDNRDDAGVVCIGGAVADRKFHLGADALVPAPAAFGLGAAATSLRARAVHGFGGVARNVAAHLTRLGLAPALVSFVGDDGDGDALRRDLAHAGIDARFVTRMSGATTAQYVAVLDADGELVLEVADMTIFEHFDANAIERIAPAIGRAAWVFADANVPAATIADLAVRAQQVRTSGERTVPGPSFRLAVDAVSVPRASLLPPSLHGIDILFLNEAEAEAYVDAHAAGVPAEHHDGDRGCSLARAVRAHGAAAVVMTRGVRGAILAAGGDVHEIAAYPAARVVDVTGAGDALVAATLAHLLARTSPRDAVSSDDLRAAVAAGLQAAALAVASAETVAP